MYNEKKKEQEIEIEELAIVERRFAAFTYNFSRCAASERPDMSMI